MAADDAQYCERHSSSKTLTLHIPVYGFESFIVDSVFKHRPRDFYKSIICPSCRYEQEHIDRSRQYCNLKLKPSPPRHPITTKERLQKKLLKAKRKQPK